MTRTFVLLFAALACLMGCGSDDTSNGYRSAEFATLREAAGSASVEGGWIPEEMPPSAFAIREAHDIDTNELWLHFSYHGEHGLDSFLRGCTPSRSARLPNERKTAGIAPGWPGALTRNAPAGESSTLALFTCSRMRHGGVEHGASIAVDQTTRSVWYWLSAGTS